MFPYKGAKSMKKIEIMGCGYIGLPTAITFTLAGYEV